MVSRLCSSECPDGGRVMLGREHRLEELRGGELEAVGGAGRADVPAAEGDGGRGHDACDRRIVKG